MKCRFQDNLEFLQWMKKFWDTYFAGNAYDAVARRNATAKKAKKPLNNGIYIFYIIINYYYYYLFYN